MNYFTPDLIVLGQSTDTGVLDQQERLWEEAGDRYVAYLDSVRPAFPPGLRRLDDGYYLHDAVISSMGVEGRSFQIVLRLDTPPRSQLTLRYDLVEDPVLLTGQVPQVMGSPGEPVAWLYDEIEQQPGATPTWRQFILLGNGSELQLHFRDVEVRHEQPFSAAGMGWYAAGTR